MNHKVIRYLCRAKLYAMTIEKEILNSIKQQFASHSRTNLFYKHFDSNSQFLPESKAIITGRKQGLLQINNESRANEWIDLMTDYARRTFCLSNQYLDLREEHIFTLRKVYLELWMDIIAEIKKNDIDFNRLQKNHLKRLTDWMRQTNGFACEINNSDSPEIIEVVCAEYSSSLQLQLLHINSDLLQAPVLDIGCGEHAYLVRYLQNTGIEAFGMDRLIDATIGSKFIRTDWMDYTFNSEEWGSIIANHSFALHFIHQNERKDGDYIGYAKKYLEILKSLKKGGVFYYAPSLPFIECYLPENTYDVKIFMISDNYSATHITRKK